VSGLWLRLQVKYRSNPIIDSPAEAEPIKIGPNGMPATEAHSPDAPAEPILLEMQPDEEAPVDASLSEARFTEEASAEMAPIMETVEPESSRKRRSLYDRDFFTNLNEVKREQQEANLRAEQNKKEQRRRGQEPSMRRSGRHVSDREKRGEKESERHRNPGPFSDHSSGHPSGHNRRRREPFLAGLLRTIENYMTKGSAEFVGGLQNSLAFVSSLFVDELRSRISSLASSC